MTKKMYAKAVKTDEGQYEVEILTPEELRLANHLLRSRITDLNEKLDRMSEKVERFFQKQNEAQQNRLTALNLAKKRLQRTLSSRRA